MSKINVKRRAVVTAAIVSLCASLGLVGLVAGGEPTALAGPPDGVMGRVDADGLPLPPLTVPDQGSKRSSTGVNPAYPKLPVQAPSVTEDPASRDGDVHRYVELRKSSIDARTGKPITEMTIVEPRPDEDVEQLAAQVRANLRPSERDKYRVSVQPGDVELKTWAFCQSGLSISYCPTPLWWSNVGYADPALGVCDFSSSFFLVDQAVWSMNQTVGFDTYYRPGSQCPGGWDRYANVYSGYYTSGHAWITGLAWWGDGRIAERWEGYACCSVYFNTKAQSHMHPVGTACHELAHLFYLGHVNWAVAPSCVGGDAVAYPQLSSNDRYLVSNGLYGSYNYP